MVLPVHGQVCLCSLEKYKRAEIRVLISDIELKPRQKTRNEKQKTRIAKHETRRPCAMDKKKKKKKNRNSFFAKAIVQRNKHFCFANWLVVFKEELFPSELAKKICKPYHDIFGVLVVLSSFTHDKFIIQRPLTVHTGQNKILSCSQGLLDLRM